MSVSNDPSYYDLCLASGPALGAKNHSSTILCYNHFCAGEDISCFAGLRHSGDIVRSGGVLLHSIRCTGPQSLEEEGKESLEEGVSNLAADKALEVVTVVGERHPLVLLAEDGVCVNPRDFKPSFSIYFSNRLSLTSATPSMDKNVDLRATILPICFGQVLHGPFLLALGKDVRVDPGEKVPSFLELSKMYQSCTAVVCIVSDRMLDTARLLNPYLRINGLVILQPLQGALKMDPGVLDDSKKRKEWMEEVGGNCITAIAGPCAIVVVQILENYFFYRGVSFCVVKRCWRVY